jgi:hypothetical protein
MGLLDFLAYHFPRGWGDVRDKVRGASDADLARLGANGELYRLPLGDVDQTISVSVRGRPAHFGRPRGWEQISASDLAEAQPARTNDGEYFAWLNRKDASPDDPYWITLGSVLSQDRVARAHPVRWVLEAERYTSLSATAPVREVQFGNGVGYLWHMEGAMEGFKLGKPGRHMIPVHTAEMWDVSDNRVLKVVLVAPIHATDEALVAFNTVIASWGWD